MATNKPPSRKTHISRIYGTNRKGERLDDMYADVERMDIVKSASQRPPDNQYQKIVRKFKWCDDPDQDGYDPKGNKNRKTEIIKVCDPENTKDVNDPDEWIPIRVIKSVKSTGGSGRGEAFQDNFLNVFINQELASGRTVKVRRVVHYDTNIDEVCQTLIDADPERREVVVPSEKYTKDLESKDKDQYVEYEIVKALKHRGNSLSVNGQFGRTKLLNQYLIDESEIATQKIRGNNDINPPYRLDPYQNIVNIKFSDQQAAVVGLRRKATDDNYRTATSNDGAGWDGGFGGGTSNAATGLGRTVVASGRVYVAFGKPKNGDSCFIAVDAHDIKRGVLSEDGSGLEWTIVGSISFDEGSGGQATSCAFAGGGFFISYVTGDDHAYLAVSFDGISFANGINPWPGVATASSADGDSPSPSPVGGNVAYDKDEEVYVTVGSFSRHYLGQWVPGEGDSGDPFQASFIDSNFMSSRSRDGMNWTPHFDTSEGGGFDHSVDGAGDIGADASTERMGSRVTFGNGLFVAGASYKTQQTFPASGPGFRTKLVVTACGVATSADGVSWTNVRLPGSTVNLTSGGDGISVKFIKAKRPDSSKKGFFLLGGEQYTDNGSGPGTGLLWISDDGTNWSQINSYANEFPVIISAINKSRGTIVNI